MNITSYRERYNELTDIFLKKYIKKNLKKNIVFSPLSIIIIMAILADAADGKTREEIIRTLSGNNATDGAIESFRGLQNQIMQSEALSTANAVIIKPSLIQSLTKDYEEKFERRFKGRLFASENRISDVNSWISDKTKGMIKNIADDSTKNLDFVIMNVVAFEAEWKEKYKNRDVINEDFTNFDKSISRVKMLQSYESTYLENADFRGFMKPYKGDKFSYVALIPKEEKYELTGIDMASFNLDNYRRNDDASVQVIMPEFTCDTTEGLTGMFQELGINKAFTQDADFSAFTSEWQQLGSIYQKAYIKVNREGTKATAVTGMAGDASCIDIEVQEIKLNRPFMYAIIHNETNIPIFAGVIQHLDDLPKDEDRLTIEEISQIITPIYDSICDRVLDEDGVVEGGTPECEFFKRARIAYDNRQIQELKEIAQEVKDYMDAKITFVDNTKKNFSQKISSRIKKTKTESSIKNDASNNSDAKEQKNLLTPQQVKAVLDTCYQKAVDGIPHVNPSIEKFAGDYLNKYISSNNAAKAMIKNQIAKCATSGFITGFGGVLTLPVSIPANVGSVIYVQMRMIACAAYMAGLDVKSDQVQTLVYACLAGVSVNEILKKAGIKTGEKLAENLIKKIPGSVCISVNKKVGFRFITKFGETGIVNLGKMIPVAGALVGGGFDLVETKIIGNRAYKMFFEGNFQFDNEQKFSRSYQGTINGINNAD